MYFKGILVFISAHFLIWKCGLDPENITQHHHQLSLFFSDFSPILLSFLHLVQLYLLYMEMCNGPWKQHHTPFFSLFFRLFYLFVNAISFMEMCTRPWNDEVAMREWSCYWNEKMKCFVAGLKENERNFILLLQGLGMKQVPWMDENPFHSFMVAEQVFLRHLPVIHWCSWQLLVKFWECLNLVNDDNFRIPEVQFKITIISSLPLSWDNFTWPYISIQKGNTADPKVHATSQELIGVLKEEYVQCLQQSRKLPKQETIHQATFCKPKPKLQLPSLTSHLADTECCGWCNMRSHKTTDCRFLGQSKCGICDHFGYRTEDCYSGKAKELKWKYEPIADKSGNKKRKFELFTLLHLFLLDSQNPNGLD